MITTAFLEPANTISVQNIYEVYNCIKHFKGLGNTKEEMSEKLEKMLDTYL